MHTLHLLHDITYGAHPRQAVDLILPAVPDGAPLVLLAPGAWWRDGQREALRPLALALALAGLPTALCGYRPLGSSQDGSILIEDLRSALATAMEEGTCAGCRSRSPLLLGIGSATLPLLELATLADLPAGLRPAALIGLAPLCSAEPWPGADAEIGERLRTYRGDRTVDLPGERLPDLLFLHGRDDDGPPEAAARSLVDAVLANEGKAMLVDCDGRVGHLDSHLDGPATTRVITAIERFLAG